MMFFAQCVNFNKINKYFKDILKSYLWILNNEAPGKKRISPEIILAVTFYSKNIFIIIFIYLKLV